MSQTVLITGTGRPYALGFNLVRRYLENGDCVFASVRRPSEALETLKQEYAGRLHILTMDISSTESVNAAASEENAKACLRYMQLLYVDTQFRDLLAYGIEGKHFNYYEGTVLRTEQGGNEYRLDNFVTGPATSATVISASKDVLADQDLWAKVFEEYKNAKQSDTHGFVYNGSYSRAMTAALDAIWDENRALLETGTVDPDETMAEIKEQMEAIGLGRVAEEAQKQLDTYLARLSEGM